MCGRYLGLCLALVLASCGGGSARPTTAGADDGWGGDDEWDVEPGDGEGHASAAHALGITPPEAPWASMSAYDREMYMAGKVLPIMGEVFQQHDGERYAQFQCESCHGRDMHEVSYRMPSPRMFRIPREGTPAHRAMLRSFGPVVEFMRDTVTPTMSTIMGNDTTCGSCHPTQ